MSIWELARLERAGRMRLDRGVERWIAAALAEERVQTLPVTREIALAGAAVAGRLRDPADQLIYATAVEHDAVLVSRDGIMRDLDPRRVVW
jgi:PIN domain nuclease of toxin-antitoxin system